MKNWEEFVKFIKEIKCGALATIDGDKPQVRAMAFITLEDDKAVYTTTNYKSNKIAQIKENSNVCLYFWKDHTVFKIKGKAELFPDNEKLKQKILDANPIWKKHYPLGAKDPSFCVIKIIINKLEHSG